MLVSKVIIFGTGRGADAAYRHFTADSHHEICGFTVDEKYLACDNFHGLPVVPFETVQNHFPPVQYKLFLLMGFEEMNERRAHKYLGGKEKGYHFATYISSRVHSLEPVKAGENCFIMENQTLNLDVIIGNNVVMWSGNHVGDSSIVGDNVWMSSHVCIGGNSVIGANSFLGNNCAIIDGVTVGRHNFIGANTLIAENTIDYSTYIVEKTQRATMKSDMFMRITSLHCRNK